jgi:tripartite ATP-independent transporter DctP family solute receptor
MMLKKFRYLSLVMALILVIVSGTTFAAKKPVKLIFGHCYASEHAYGKGAYYFKELVEKNSKGQIVVDVFPGSQLGGPGELLQATRNGAQHVTISSMGGFISGLWPKLATFEVPWLICDYARLSRIAEKFDSLIDPDELVTKTGVRSIALFAYNMKNLYTKFPINKLEDIKGLKIRVPEIPVLVAMWKALGAVPTVITNSDIYTALATGTIDACDGGLPWVYTNKLYEQVKCCALTDQQCGFNIVIINDNFWNGLTATQKKIIQNAADKCEKSISNSIEKEDKKAKQLLAKAGMKFTKPDRALFREKGKTVWSKFGNAELLKKIEAIK